MNKNLQFKSYQNISDVREDPVLRIPCNIPEVNWIYGVTRKGPKFEWGLPLGKLSVWIAPSGTGKSRALIEVAKGLTRVHGPKGKYQGKVLYFQGETPLGEFKSLVGKGGIKVIPKNFFVSDANTLAGQIKAIRDLTKTGVRPHLIIVDSINMLEEFGNGSKSNIQEILFGKDGKDGEEGYKDIATRLRSHVIFVSQTNKNGEASGSNVLPHLVDQTFYIEKRKGTSFFVLTSGDKCRYAVSGRQITWQHKANCVECVSNNRFKDKVWVNTLGVSLGYVAKWKQRDLAKAQYLAEKNRPLTHAEDVARVRANLQKDPVAWAEGQEMAKRMNYNSSLRGKIANFFGVGKYTDNTDNTSSEGGLFSWNESDDIALTGLIVGGAKVLTDSWQKGIDATKENDRRLEEIAQREREAWANNGGNKPGT